MTESPGTTSLAQTLAVALPARTPLRAGPLSLVMEEGDLRCVRLGEREVIRRIHVAVRDPNWGTLPPSITDLELRVGKSDFRLSYLATWRRDDIHLVGRIVAEGREDGSVLWSFDGEAKTTFLSNRIGLCVLHPIRECAGARARLRRADGTVGSVMFPALVSREQPVPGFTDLSGIAHEVEAGTWVELAFEGDQFEMEDQRNWIDASFKTYCPSLRHPIPVRVEAGTKICHGVSLRLVGGGGPVTVAVGGGGALEPVAIRPEVSEGVRLPEIGLGMASHGRVLAGREADRLARLGVSHLRVDLRLADARWKSALATAARDAVELGAALELAIHLPAAGDAELQLVARELGRLRVDLSRALILRDGQRSTTAADLAAARAALEDCGMAIGAGTDADLYQLNLQRPPEDADFIFWSMNPQVHASDAASIAETPEAVGHQLLSVHRYFPGLPLVVTPVTLKPRFNPVAASPDTGDRPGELPPQVDPRQLSIFAAAWTVAMFRALALGGADSVTFFETTGWRGVLETEGGSPVPGSFPSVPGAVFPVYHALADIAEFSRGRVIPVSLEGEGAPSIGALFLRMPQRHRLMLANLGGVSCPVSLGHLGNGPRWRRLDADVGLEPLLSPESFRKRWTRLEGNSISVPACSVLTLDFDAT